MLSDFTKQLFNELNQTFDITDKSGTHSSSQLKAIIESSLRRLQLPTREEFDAQQNVLQRTREKLERLEQKLEEMEKKLPSTVK